MNGDIGIGKLIEQERDRDAIHVAVAPVEAGEKLTPGARVGLVDGKAAEVEDAIGIVDPFLTKVVRPGQKFYLFLFPGSITSLRHAWNHPAFDGKAEPPPAAESPTPTKAKAEAWLRDYAKQVNPYIAGNRGEDAAYEELMHDLKIGCLTYHGTDMHGRGELVDEDELKRHADVVLDKPVNFDTFEYFSCSC